MIEDLKKFINNDNNIIANKIEKINNIIKRYRGGVFLYGRGFAFRYYKQLLTKYGIQIAGIIDGNKEYHGSFFEGLPVMGVEDAIKKGVAAVVISSPKYYKEIKKFLLTKILAEKIFSFEAEIYCTFIHDVISYKTFLLENINRIEKLYNSLQDVQSKNTLEYFIKGRLSGDLKYFADVCVPTQYYPRDLINFNDNEVFVELGSYDGETLKEFLELVDRKYKACYCFEPDTTSLGKLYEIQKLESSDKIHIIPKAAYDKKTSLSFAISEGTGTSCVSDSSMKTVTIEADSVDNCINEKISFIKMDIEGSELKALKGAEQHLKNDRPKLAICVYHNPSDFIDIFEYLNELNLGYKFYLRHHNCSATETVLYAL